MNKKIIVTAPYFYPKIGGMENYAYNIGKGLKEKYGWEVIVITSNHKEKKYIEEYIDGIKIYRLARWFKISNTPINPLWYFQIKKIIKKEKPNVINAHTPVTFVADITALACGNIPLATSLHSGSMVKEFSFLNPLINLYEKYFLTALFKKSAKIICYENVKHNLNKHKDKVVDIPPGVDINTYKPSLKKPANDILFVGRMEKGSDWKGIKFLLEAVSLITASMPNISLRLVGSGDRVDYFRRYSKILGIDKNVNFVGFKVGNDLVREYQESKLLVLPSITESEAFGMVLIEMGACGKPVVGSNIGGIPYVIDDNKTGLLVPPKDSKSLAEAIIKIISDSELAGKMGENGYKKVKENFTWEKQIKLSNDLFTSLI